jgi:hypothetical protein
MAAKVLVDLTVGITEQQHAALRAVTDLLGLKASQYCRQALVAALVRDGALASPVAQYQQSVAEAKA